MTQLMERNRELGAEGMCITWQVSTRDLSSGGGSVHACHLRWICNVLGLIAECAESTLVVYQDLHGGDIVLSWGSEWDSWSRLGSAPSKSGTCMERWVIYLCPWHLESEETHIV